MRYFLIRPIQNTQKVYINDNNELYKISIERFKEFEPELNLDISIKQLEYYPELLHEVFYYNGTSENLPTTVTKYDGYINKISVYKALETGLNNANDDALLPQTLQAAKTLVSNNIRAYATQLVTSLLNQPNYNLESYRWQGGILYEAKNFIMSENTDDAPNLVAQRLVEINNPSANVNAEPFKAAILAKAQYIVDEDILINNSINHYVGMQNRWLQTVIDFQQSNMETQKQAITRLLAIDFTVGWEVPS